MTDFDPLVADRLRRITLIAQDIASRPGLGPYEVGVMQELAEEAADLSGIRDEHERQAALRRYHWSGRAVDLPPRSALAKWLKKNT